MYEQVIDVGMALEYMLTDDNTASETYELFGPTQYSMAEIAQLVDKEIIKQRRHINLTKRIIKPIAGLMNRTLWWHTMSADEVEREFIDQKIDPNAKTFKDLKIEPSELRELTFHYLVSPFGNILLVETANSVASFSKATGAHRFTTSLPRQSARSGRRGSTYMLLTINEIGIAQGN